VGATAGARAGSTNARLTAHMGFIVPDGCSIRAGTEWRQWQVGKCIVFDDSFEHEVRTYTPPLRIRRRSVLYPRGVKEEDGGG